MPRVVTALCAAVVAVAAMTAESAASADVPKTWYVHSGGHDTNICDSTSSTCETIGGALAQAGPGDTIVIGDGTYSDVVSISEPITLQAWPSQSPDVTALLTVPDVGGAVTVSGLGFSGAGRIEVDGNTGTTTISGNTFDDLPGSAITLTGPTALDSPAMDTTISGNRGSVQAGVQPIALSGQVALSTNGQPNAIGIDGASVSVTGAPSSMTTEEVPDALAVSATTTNDLANVSLDVAVTTDASATSSPIVIEADTGGGFSPVSLTGSNGAFGAALMSAEPLAANGSLTPGVHVSAVDAPPGTTTVAFNLDQLLGSGDVLNTVASSSFAASLHLNSAPVAADQTVTVAWNHSAQITLTASDADIQDTPGDWQLVTGPSHGTANQAGPVITYSPNADYSGSDLFTFTADDGHGNTSNTATVSITVSADAAPIANDITVADVVPLNSSGIDIDLSKSSSDGDSSSLTYYYDTTGTRGSVTVTGYVAKYVPPATGGSDSFTYWVSDGTLSSEHKTVSLTVDSAPVMSDPDAVSMAHYLSGSPPTSTQVAFSATDAQPLSYSVMTNPDDGSVVQGTGGTFTYTPAAGFTGTDSFTVNADDGLGGVTTATASISVTDQPPTTTGFTTTIPETVAPRTIQLTASDPDSDPVTYALDPSAPTFLTVNRDSGVVMVNQTTAHATEFSFGYTVADALTGSPQSATGTIQVLVNTPPSGTAQTLSTAYNAALTGELGATDGGTITKFQRIAGPTHEASFHLDQPTGSFSYAPARGYAGKDSFTFEAFDGYDWSAPTTVAITVRPANTTLIVSVSPLHPTSADHPVATVRVSSAGNESGGMVTIKTGGFGTPSRKVINGIAKVPLPQFPGGPQSITAVFAGTRTAAAQTSKKLPFTVTRVASRIGFKTNPLQLTTRTSNATATITVTAGPFHPSGGIVTIDENGNRLAQGTPKVGVVTLRLARFSLGQHNLTVSYTGTPWIAASSVIEIERVGLG